MRYPSAPLRILYLFFFTAFLFSSKSEKNPAKKDIVAKPEKMAEHESNDLEKTLDYIGQNKGKLNDTVTLSYSKLDDSIYEAKKYTSLWNDHEKWIPLADSLFNFIENSKNYGLFPDDYYYRPISFIRRVLVEDTLARKNAILWARADVLLTDAFFKLAKDLKQGRLQPDSV